MTNKNLPLTVEEVCNRILSGDINVGDRLKVKGTDVLPRFVTEEIVYEINGNNFANTIVAKFQYGKDNTIVYENRYFALSLYFISLPPNERGTKPYHSLLENTKEEIKK